MATHGRWKEPEVTPEILAEVMADADIRRTTAFFYKERGMCHCLVLLTRRLQRGKATRTVKTTTDIEAETPRFLWERLRELHLAGPSLKEVKKLCESRR